MIYDEKVIEKTIEVLKEFEGKVLNYEDERSMVNEVFNREVEDSNNSDKTLKDLCVEKSKRTWNF